MIKQTMIDLQKFKKAISNLIETETGYDFPEKNINIVKRKNVLEIENSINKKRIFILKNESELESFYKDIVLKKESNSFNLIVDFVKQLQSPNFI